MTDDLTRIREELDRLYAAAKAPDAPGYVGYRFACAAITHWPALSAGIARLSALEGENERLAGLLMANQFGGHNGVCIACRQTRFKGHKPDCKLAAALTTNPGG